MFYVLLYLFSEIYRQMLKAQINETETHKKYKENLKIYVYLTETNCLTGAYTKKIISVTNLTTF